MLTVTEGVRGETNVTGQNFSRKLYPELGPLLVELWEDHAGHMSHGWFGGQALHVGLFGHMLGP